MRIAAFLYASSQEGRANVDIFSLFKQMQHRGHDCLLVTLNDTTRAGVRPDGLTTVPMFARFPGLMVRYPLYMCRVLLHMVRFKPDIVICSKEYVLPLVFVIARLFRLRILTVIRELSIEGAITKVKGAKRSLLLALFYLELMILRMVDAVVAIDEGIGSWYKLLLPDRDIGYLPASVDLHAFDKCHEEGAILRGKMFGEYSVVIGYSGSQASVRRVDLLLRAAGILRERLQGCQLAVVMTGGTSKSGLVNRDDAVIQTGWLPRRDLVSFLHVIDIAVDTFPRAWPESAQLATKILDYMAAGKPVVIPADWYNSRYLKRREPVAIFYTPGSVTDLAEKTKILILDKGLREHLGRNARKFVEEHHNAVTTANHLEGILAALLRL